MAEEEVVVAAATANATNTNTSPVASDHNKRKLQDLEPEEAQAPAEANPSDDANKKSDDVAEGDTQEAKRLRTVDENKSDGLASENGIGKDKPEGGQEKSDKDEQEEEDVNAQETVGKGEEPANADDNDTVDNDTKEAASVGDSKKDADDNDTVDNDIKEAASVGDSKKDDATEKQQEADEETARPPEEESEPESDDAQTTSRKMEVPNDKVGVLIGKGGDTIRYLQYNSGAKIQITRDMDADPHSTTRPVELIGTLSSISKAEKLINAVIAEADAGGSPSLVARGLPSAQTAGVGDQIEMQVPNEKVGLIIGRGGDTIKALQAKSGARIQLIPQHPPEGDASKERTVRVTGDRKQIEIAREMIKDVMSQMWLLPFPWGQHCFLGVAIDNHHSLSSTEERYQALNLGIAGC